MSDLVKGMNVSRESRSSTFSGYLLLLVMLAFIALGGVDDFERCAAEWGHQRR